MGLFGPQDWAGEKYYRVTPALEFLPALLPAGLAAAIFWWRRPSGARAADLQRLLACWVLMLLTLVFVYQSALVRQHMISLGAATLLAAALVTPARALPVLCLLCCATSSFVWWQTMRPNPGWFLPRDYFTAQRDLAVACRTHDVVVAPTDLSL